MSKPSIAILHYSAFPVIGGVEVIIQDHALLFTEQGYSVKLIVGEGKPFDERIPVKAIPEMRSLYLVNKRLYQELEEGKEGKEFVKIRDFLYEKLKQELAAVDIVIIHNLLTMHFNLPLTAALAQIFDRPPTKGKKFIAWCHDATQLDPNYTHHWRTEYPWKLLAESFPGVKYVAISDLRQRGLAKLFQLKEDDIQVVPDGINPSTFLDLSPLALPIFTEYGLFKEDFVFLYPTRIVRRKNIELAIRIIKAMNDKGKYTSLLITSPPDPHNKDSMHYYNSLRDLAKELKIEKKILFLYEYKDKQGERIKIDDKLRRDLYLLSDMLLFPSSAEGFGIPLLEAGLTRLPVACSQIEPLTEVGEEDVFYLDLKSTPEVMAGGIIDYLTRHLTLPLFKKVFRRYTYPAIFSENIKALLQK